MAPRWAIGVWLIWQSATGQAFGAQPVDYVKQVKPILESRCYACHGAIKQQSGLRLDTAQRMRKGGDSGPAIEAGKASASLLIGVVTGDAGFRMPPEGKPLTPDQIELLKRWIDTGATAPPDEQPAVDPKQHWSFQTPARPKIAAIQRGADVRNPIDAFIAAEHDRRGLEPNPPADKHVLLRRVYLDLIGLPPTRQELQAFLADHSERAYERVVDRLLASPRYGERWGRHWMDVWRYSDWYGRRAQKEIRYSQYHIWRWRDWIIDSLNADVGYDRMIIEMLAGDEVAPTDPQVLRATGFLARNWYKFNRSSWLQETIEHTSMGFLGITMKCARCHDHKFDPVSQEDYYRFRAFFEPHDVRTDMMGTTTDLLKDGLARVYDKDLSVPTYLFERGDDRYPDKEHPLQPGVPSALGKSDLDIAAVSLPAESFYPALRPSVVAQMLDDAGSKVRAEDAAIATASSKLVAAQAQSKAITHSDETAADASPQRAFLEDDFNAPNGKQWRTVRGKWNYENGDLTQTEITRFATLVSQADHPRNFQATVRYTTTDGGRFRSVGLSFDVVGEQEFQAVYTSANDDRPSVQAFHRAAGKEVYPRAGIVPCDDVRVDHQIVLQMTVRGLDLSVSVNGKPTLEYRMPKARRPGKFAVWVHNGTARLHDIKVTPLFPTVAEVKQAIEEAQRGVEIAQSKRAIARAELASLEARLAAERAKFGLCQEDELSNLAKAATKAERTAEVSKAQLAVLQAQHTLQRLRAGPLKNGKKRDAAMDAEKKLAASIDTLSAAKVALDKDDVTYQPIGTVYPAESTGRRLALAKWIASGRNPRTARIAVNHIWLRHFGAALVPSVEDFGLRSNPPSFPKLLDWLAVEFVDGNWSMKAVHRLIVTSAVYRRSDANIHTDNIRIDPENRFLWRMNRQRMQAEAVRDSLLYLAGTLDMTVGGPELPENQGQRSGRRSLYFRVTPDNKMEFLELFDLANPNQCYRRTESVVPQQALALSNSVVAMEQSRLVARHLDAQLRIGKDRANDAAFIRAAFQHVLSRGPTNDEQSRCRLFLAEHTRLLERARKLTPFPEGPATSVAPASHADQRARENLVHVLFNHNDFVTIH